MSSWVAMPRGQSLDRLVRQIVDPWMTRNCLKIFPQRITARTRNMPCMICSRVTVARLDLPGLERDWSHPWGYFLPASALDHGTPAHPLVHTDGRVRGLPPSLSPQGIQRVSEGVLTQAGILRDFKKIDTSPDRGRRAPYPPYICLFCCFSFSSSRHWGCLCMHNA